MKTYLALLSMPIEMQQTMALKLLKKEWKKANQNPVLF